MVSPKERSVAGWDIKKLYETPNAEDLESLAFFSAFAHFHDINGHRIECILTKPKYSKPVVNVFSQNDTPGIVQVNAILIVRLSDMSGMRQGESLKVDGQLYSISAISYPLHDIARLELAGVSG